MPTPYQLTERDVLTLRQMQTFIRNFRIEGDGVTVKRTAESFIARISWPRRDVAARDALEEVWVKPTSTAGGTGVYHGKIWKWDGITEDPEDPSASDVDPDSDFDVTSFGSESDTDCIIISLREQNLPDGLTHAITPGDTPLVFFGWVIHINSDGTPVIVIDGDQVDDCEPPP